jgi:hypothetical protein
MASARKELEAAILSELRARVATLRKKSYDTLALLPEAKTEEVTVLGKLVKFTAFRESHPDGRLLILVRSDKPIFFGIGTAGTTEGFWALPGGEKREAHGDEISEFFA